MPSYPILPLSELLLKLTWERMKDLGRFWFIISQACDQFQVLSSVFLKEVHLAGRKEKQKDSSSPFSPPLIPLVLLRK